MKPKSKSLLAIIIYIVVIASGLFGLALLFSKKARDNPKRYLKRFVLIATVGMAAFIGFFLFVFGGNK